MGIEIMSKPLRRSTDPKETALRRLYGRERGIGTWAAINYALRRPNDAELVAALPHALKRVTDRR
jgi:hypothetical protein